MWILENSPSRYLTANKATPDNRKRKFIRTGFAQTKESGSVTYTTNKKTVAAIGPPNPLSLKK